MKREIKIAGRPVEVEVAENDAKRYKGLSGKDDLGSNEGMMFVWPMEKEHGLVMRDMNFGIDMVFADSEGTVTKVHSTGPDGDGATAFSKFAVELPRGWCKKVPVEEGDQIELDSEQEYKQVGWKMKNGERVRNLEPVDSDSPTLKEEILSDFLERADMSIGMFAALASETPDPTVEEVDAPYNEVEGETPDGTTTKDEILDTLAEKFYSDFFESHDRSHEGQTPDYDTKMQKEWIPYVGPEGGEGWQEAGTEEVRYQQDPPGDVHEDYSDDYWQEHDVGRYEEGDPERGEPVTEFTDEIPDLEMTDSTPEEFSSSVQQKIDEDPEMGAFLTAHPPDEMQDHDLIKATGEGVNAGAAVSPEGDLQNLYKIEGPKGTGRALLEEGIDRGGRTLDCYAGYLNRAYRQHGFREVARQEFNEEFAPDDWNYEKYGKPDVVFMAYMPDAEPEQTDNYIDDWGQAKELSRESANWDNRMEEKQNEVRIPEDEEGVHELAAEGEEEGMSEEQRNALAEAQARLIGDL